MGPDDYNNFDVSRCSIKILENLLIMLKENSEL